MDAYEDLNANERNIFDIPADGQLAQNPNKIVTAHRHVRTNAIRPNNLPVLDVPALMLIV
jgi:hypothetical protein